MKLIPLIALLAAVPASAAPDTAKVADHIHKTYNTPSSMALEIADLKASGLKGFLEGSLVIGGDAARKQPILVSQDGGWYVLGSLYSVGPSEVPGFKKLLPKEGLPPPPDLLLAPDGSLAAAGSLTDARVDPDARHRSLITLDGAAASGPKDAPVVLVTFSDLQCPACKKAGEILSKELDAYKGKVRWVYKHYPLRTNHPWAYDAAIAAACAQRQKAAAFWDLKSSFFEAQSAVSVNSVDAKAAEFAKKAGLDEAKFKACYSGKKTSAAVDKDIKEGDAVGVSGVPTIFVNGRKTRSFSWPEIKATIDEMLAGRK